MNDVVVIAGGAGHDREITVSFSRWGHGEPYDRTEGNIPDNLEEWFVDLLPETWKVENRGSRLEVHPSGRFAGGFDQLDVNTVVHALTLLGFKVELR